MKIALFAEENLYSSKRSFTLSLLAAFRRKGVTAEIFSADDLQDLLAFAPDWTFSFNTFEPLSDGRYLWDLIETPHLLFPLDPMIYYLRYSKSPFCHLACVDRGDQEVLSGSTQHLFVPHAVEKKWCEEELGCERDIDVVLIGSCYDHEGLESVWRDKYPKEVGELIEESIARTQQCADMNFLNAILSVLKESRLDPKKVDIAGIAFYVDYTLRSLDRFLLLQALEGEQVHVFGEGFWREEPRCAGWERYAGRLPHVTFHESVNFPASQELLRRSKVCLNSTPFFKNGSHERFFTGLAAGCSVLASENRYGREEFGESMGVQWYSLHDHPAAAKKVRALLSDEAVRFAQVLEGRELVRKGHTWDNRAEQLLTYFQNHQ